MGVRAFGATRLPRSHSAETVANEDLTSNTRRSSQQESFTCSNALRRKATPPIDYTAARLSGGDLLQRASDHHGALRAR